MNDIKLVLTPYKKSPNIYELSENAIESSQGKILNSISYNLEILNIPKDACVELSINDVFLKESVDGVLKIDDKWIFTEYIDNVTFSLNIYTQNSKQYLRSGIFHIDFKRDSEEGKAIENMLEYISDNNYIITNTDMINEKSMDLSFGNKHSQQFQIDMLNNILITYKKNLSAFITNSHKVSTKKPLIDNFEKLSHLSSETIVYIALHPEYLEECDVNTGITFNDKCFYPRKTLVNSVYDEKENYENKIVLSFLKTVIKFLDSKYKEIHTLIYTIPNVNISKDNISANELIYYHTKKNLINLQKNITKHIIEFNLVYKSYLKVFNFNTNEISEKPIMTQIFKSITHYRHIYDVIIYWFNNPKYSLFNENINIHLAKSSCLYEHYILLKIINAMYKSGFKCINKDIIKYQIKDSAFYKNIPYNNMFVFEKNGTIKTLFYQPVINNYSQNKGINLYRSVSISLNGERSDYYTPDYILKTLDTKESYKIIDAKFSKRQTFLKYNIQDIVYKYIFSVNPIKNDIKVDEVCIICGKGKDNNVLNLYDNINSPTKLIDKTALNIYTINAKDENEENIHNNLLHHLM